MKLISFDELGSTNDYLRRNFHYDEFDTIIAKKQTNGRGKRGSVWISNEGAALFSFYILDRNELQEKVTILVGYAVYEVLKKYIEETDRNIKIENLKFKWPNDIYYNDKKICGILCEKIRDRIIIGIGINVNNNDFGIYKEKAISLYEICGKKYEINNIVKDVVELFEEKIIKLNMNWENILGIMNSNNYLKDKKIKIKVEEKFEEKEYKFVRMDRKGRIVILEEKGQEEKVYSSLDFEIIQ